MPDFVTFSQSKSGSCSVMETQVGTSGIVCVDEPAHSPPSAWSSCAYKVRDRWQLFSGHQFKDSLVH